MRRVDRYSIGLGLHVLAPLFLSLALSLQDAMRFLFRAHDLKTRGLYLSSSPQPFEIHRLLIFGGERTTVTRFPGC